MEQGLGARLSRFCYLAFCAAVFTFLVVPEGVRRQFERLM